MRRWPWAVPAWSRFALLGIMAFALCQCGGTKSKKGGGTVATNVVVSVKEQKLALYSKTGSAAKTYPVSTSKFGLNDKPGRYGTPLGLHEVVAKIGHGARPGTVFKSRQPTGEVIQPNAPGRDPIVSRIMWLRGMEKQNQNAYGRCIYIHGTAAENEIGRPVSYGCIRMKSKDVIELFQNMTIGSRVLIVEGKLPKTVPVLPSIPVQPVPSNAPPIFLNPQQQQAPVPVPASAPQTTPQRQQIEPVNLAQSAPPRNYPVQNNPQIPSEGAPPTGVVSPFKTTQHQNGSTVIYAAPGTNASAPITLKSRRQASQTKAQ